MPQSDACVFVFAQSRQESTELIDPETDGEHDGENIIKKNQLINKNEAIKSTLAESNIYVFAILKKQKWNPPQRIPALKILHKSKQQEGRNTKGLRCVLYCESTTHRVHINVCCVFYCQVT